MSTPRKFLLTLIALPLTIAAMASIASGAMKSQRIDSGLCETTGGGRFVAIPGFPGEMIDRRLKRDVKMLVRKYKIYVTDGYSATRFTRPRASIPSASRSTSFPTPRGVAAGVTSTASRSGPSPSRTSPARPSAGSATTATPATAAAITCTSPGTTPTRSSTSRRAPSTPRAARRAAEAARAARTRPRQRHQPASSRPSSRKTTAESAPTPEAPATARARTSRARTRRTTRAESTSRPRAAASAPARSSARSAGTSSSTRASRPTGSSFPDLRRRRTSSRRTAPSLVI